MIPRIIHQVWFRFGDGPSTPPPEYDDYRKSWKKLHPNWEFKLWNEENTLEFLKKFYPKSLRIYNLYDKPILKVDFIRYHILHHYGGFYTDMDTKCISKLDNLRKYECVVFEDSIPRTSRFNINNCFIGSIKNSNLMNQCIIELNKEKDLTKSVVKITGPVFFTNVWHSLNDKTRMLSLTREEGEKYFKHFYHGTWKTWKFFLNIEKKLSQNYIYAICKKIFYK